jgi:phospholipid transport system substrate-binding protein
MTLGLLWNPIISESFAATPTEQVRETVERVRAILQDPATKGEAKRTERREMLRQAILPRFDFAEMAKRSLGSHWRNLNSRQEEFVSAFIGFVENSYVSQVESFKDEKVTYVRERIDKNFAEVDTKVVTNKGDQFSINYKLHPVGGEWKVYDVVIENISMVNNYRAQFNRILTSASFDELLKKLREKGDGKTS